MPLLLEIVTPERLAYADDVDAVVCPGIEGELGVLPHHAPLLTTLGVGELRIRKGGQEEFFAIAGGFLQVRPDKVVVMAETADLASEIDLEAAEQARGGRAGPRSRASRSRPTWRVPGPRCSGRCCASGSPSAGIARARAGGRSAHGRRAPVPLGVPGAARRSARPSASRAAARCAARSPISGSKNAALKLLAAATLTGERCRFTNVPEIADVDVMVEVLRDLGVVVDHPAPNIYEVAAGDVDWLFVPLEAAAKMRASFILLGPLLARFGRVIISNPGGDRIGRRR